MDKIINVPFGYLLDWLYQFTTNYGVALILFAIIVQLVLLPITAKSKRSMMKMSRLSPRLQEIKEKYANDQQKQTEAIQKLYKDENVSMTGGCLWSFVPLLILIPLYAVIREPITYMLHETAENAGKIVEVIQKGLPDLFTGQNTFYGQLIAAPHIQKFAEAIREAGIAVSDRTLNGLNFMFLGIDLGAVPTFTNFVFDWAHVGSLLIPILSAGSQILATLVSQRMNNSLVTDKNGIQDKETAKNSQANKSGKAMLWMMPLMSLWIGFSVPAALSLYWFAGGMIRLVEDVILTKRYRKIYDAEDAERLKRHMEQEALEAEKERQRAEKRAANPDGITENTSKKKRLQRLLRQRNTPRKRAKLWKNRRKSRPCPVLPAVPTARAGLMIPTGTAVKLRRNNQWKKPSLPPARPLILPLRPRCSSWVWIGTVFPFR